VISSFRMDMYIDPDSLSFLHIFSECWVVGSLQLRFPILGQASSFATVHYLLRYMRSIAYVETSRTKFANVLSVRNIDMIQFQSLEAFSFPVIMLLCICFLLNTSINFRATVKSLEYSLHPAWS